MYPSGFVYQFLAIRAILATSTLSTIDAIEAISTIKAIDAIMTTHAINTFTTFTTFIIIQDMRSPIFAVTTKYTCHPALQPPLRLTNRRIAS